METKLNNNEVRYVAEMQRRIDSYEGFIKAVFMMARFSKKDINYPLFDGADFTKEMNFIWRFVKDKL
jgi:hypothetical protein